MLESLMSVELFLLTLRQTYTAKTLIVFSFRALEQTHESLKMTAFSIDERFLSLKGWHLTNISAYIPAKIGGLE